jgi:hypothetical protein
MKRIYDIILLCILRGFNLKQDLCVFLSVFFVVTIFETTENTKRRNSFKQD